MYIWRVWSLLLEYMSIFKDNGHQELTTFSLTIYVVSNIKFHTCQMYIHLLIWNVYTNYIYVNSNWFCWNLFLQNLYLLILNIDEWLNGLTQWNGSWFILEFQGNWIGAIMCGSSGCLLSGTRSLSFVSQLEGILWIHSNTPTKHFDIKMRVNKNNNETTSDIKHTTRNGSIFVDVWLATEVLCYNHLLL